MEVSLSDKVAMVTGGSQGIGRAASLALARSGAKVVVVSRKMENLEKIAEEIRALGQEPLVIPAHVGKMEQFDDLVQTAVKKCGRIDILVNNAGTNVSMDSALDIEERAWDVVMNLNLKGLFFLSQKVARVMKEKGGGAIINISSVAGLSPDILPAYSISKAGVIMATKVMASEWAQYGIRVNAIAPGVTRTKFTDYFWEHREILDKMLPGIPMGRPGQPEDMASMIVLLASDAASYITGAIIPIDGGTSI